MAEASATLDVSTGMGREGEEARHRAGTRCAHRGGVVIFPEMTRIYGNESARVPGVIIFWVLGWSHAARA